VAASLQLSKLRSGAKEPGRWEGSQEEKEEPAPRLHFGSWLRLLALKSELGVAIWELAPAPFQITEIGGMQNYLQKSQISQFLALALASFSSSMFSSLQ